MSTELRWHLHVRILAPFACSFGRIGLQQWLALNVPGWASYSMFG